MVHYEVCKTLNVIFVASDKTRFGGAEEADKSFLFL